MRITDRSLCTLNGVIGDTLEKKKSWLSIQMRLYNEKGPLSLTQSTLKQVGVGEDGKICILAHGSCSSESDWKFKNDFSKNYGVLLQSEMSYTPFFLRYNSGLHISTNGKRLSDLLEKLVRSYPSPINEIILIGHSMGGLLFRSACYYGKKKNRRWVRLVRKVFYLGTPHLGTHFEKLGKLTTSLLNIIPNPVTKVIAVLGDLRSDGIKDLRHGYVTDEDWQKQNADDLFYYHQNKLPLLKGVDHYLICGTLSKVIGSKMGRLFGDGMVHPASGTGRGLFQSSRIPFLETHCKVFPDLSHFNLLRSKRVYQQIKMWCSR